MHVDMYILQTFPKWVVLALNRVDPIKNLWSFSIRLWNVFAYWFLRRVVWFALHWRQ